MVSFLALLKNDLKLFLKDWKEVVLLLVIPVFFIIFIVFALSPYYNRNSFVEPFDIALVDKEDTTQSKVLIQQLDKIKLFKTIIKVDEIKAKELIRDNKIAAAIIIPEGFSSSVANGENKEVNVMGNKAMPVQAYAVKTLITSAANVVSAGQSAIYSIYEYSKEAGLSGEKLQKEYRESTMQVFMRSLARNEIFSSSESVGFNNLTPMEYYTAALMVIFLMYAGMPGMKMLVNERHSGITSRLKATTVGMWQVILSKFVTIYLLSIIQLSIIILFSVLVLKNYWGASISGALIIFLVVVFAVSSWSVFVSSVSTSPKAADAIGNLGILVMAVLGGSIYPLSTMPETIRNLSSLTINRWAMEGFMNVFSGEGSINVFDKVYPLVIIGFVLMFLSILIFAFRSRFGKEGGSI